MRNRKIWLVFLLAAAGCAAPDRADLVIVDGTVYTAEAKQPVAEAVAVKDGRILAVGDDAEILPLIGEGTRVIHLDGAFIYPGFTDSHVHLRGVGERELTLNLEGVESVQALQARLAEEAARREPGEWIVGRGWIETHWNPPRFPTRADLDAAAPVNPVALTRADGHALVANSRALELAGIDAATEAPFGGAIPRNERGEPTGMLVDNAMALLDGVMPDSTIAADIALVTGAKRSARMGWTGVQIAGNSWEEAMLLRKLVAAGRIPIRIYDAVRGPSADAGRLLEHGPVIGESDGRFTLRSIKVSVDGALGSRGAALLEPYADAETTGLITWREEDLAPLYRAALEKG
ncbi:MAG TPA: amidohydrolase family protein, partial [Gammaproteobacteria bacterium]